MGRTFTIDPISHKRLSNLGEVDKHGNVLKEQNMEKNNAHIVKQFQKKY